MKVRCDKCRIEFLAMLQETEKETEKQGTIIRTYLKCPNCGAEYDVCYNNSVSLSVQKAIRKDSEKMKHVQTEQEYYKLYRRIKKRQKRLVREQERAEVEFKKKETERNGR